MKLKSTLIIAVTVMLLASCSKERYTAEGLAIPIIHAIQQNDAGDLKCLMPDKDKVNELWAPNAAALGGTYYNKYTSSYRKANLLANIETDLDIINNSAETNSLDWDRVALGAVEKEEVIDSLQNFTWVTTDLRFPTGNYQLRYRTAQYNGIWYLLGDIDFAQTLPY